MKPRLLALVLLLMLAGCAAPSTTTHTAKATSSPLPSLHTIPFPEEESMLIRKPIELSLNRSFVAQNDLYHHNLELRPNVTVVATYDLQVHLNQTVHLRLNWTAQDWRFYPPDVKGVEFTPHHEWDLKPGWVNLTVQVTIRETYSHHGQNITITPNMETVPIKFPARQQDFFATLL